MECKTVKVYNCDYCNKKLFVKHAMVKHEMICNKNPENIKACHFCEHLIKVKMNLSFENGYDPDFGTSYIEKESEVFKCEKLNKLMYPFSIERKDLPKKFPCTYEAQEPMPNRCSFFEEISFGI